MGINEISKVRHQGSTKVYETQSLKSNIIRTRSICMAAVGVIQWLAGIVVIKVGQSVAY